LGTSSTQWLHELDAVILCAVQFILLRILYNKQKYPPNVNKPTTAYTL